MNGQLEIVACGFCHTKDAALLFTKNGMNIVQCKSCGLVYTNPRIAQNDASAVYDFSYFNSSDSVSCGYDGYLAERLAIEKTFVKRIEFIMKHAPNLKTGFPHRALDVGCALGFLLNILAERGWETEGVELSDYACSFAEKELGLSVKKGTLRDAHFTGQPFDLVTSWDVIEHSYEPLQDLQIMYNLLKRGGFLSIITPNRDSFHVKVVGEKWVEYEKPHEHLYFFGMKNIKRILENIGFRIIRKTTAGKYITVGFMLNRLNSYSRIFGLIDKKLGNKFGGRHIYVDPGDKMHILACKT
jgi:2-polyprenyl-3-methyl-5-hydroxy-6-metoxy-1,4-benzoquinol methylase